MHDDLVAAMDSASWLLRCRRGLPSTVAPRLFQYAAAHNTQAFRPLKNAPRAAYSTVAQLPRLPVQPLSKTLATLSQVLHPLMTNDEMNDVDKMIVDFGRADGVGVKLQKYLEERAATHENWLSDWWLDAAYLMGRAPCPITTSPGLAWPKFDFHGQDQQIHFCSLLISAALEFKHKIDSHSLPQDYAGKAPLDMTQYELVFGTTRVPGLGKDKMLFGNEYKQPSRHYILAKKGHFFRVPCYDSAGRVLNPEQLKASIYSCLTGCEKRNQLHKQIGVMTTENRDNWALFYQKLEQNEVNAASLRDIEEALFVLCLDEMSAPMRPDYNEDDDFMAQTLHGGGSRWNASNRWYDKCLQFIVTPSGYAGMTYEHSPAEGPAVAALMDFCMDKLESRAFDTTRAEGEIESPKKLRFELDDQDHVTIVAAANKWQRAADDISLRVFKFAHYGKNFPKSMKLSPDSFIQLALHLAYYKIHHACPPTYETGSLRTFHLGRTDTIRLPNDASVEFVRRMCQANTTAVRKAHILTQAVQAHRQYQMQVGRGEGVDRHLLGFKMAAAELGLTDLPDLLTSSLIGRMSHFQVSTSQVPTKHEISLAFGPSVSDCYGVCYNPKETNIAFTIAAFNHHPNTSVTRFREALNQSLLDMHACLVESASMKAKL